MSINNLQRDPLWLNILNYTGQPFSGASGMDNDTLFMNSDGVVNSVTGFCKADKSANTLMVVDAVKSIGTYMEPPINEKVPYRVKASLRAMDGDHRQFLVVGYGIASPTGTDDVISNAVYIPFLGEYDGLVIVPNIDPLDAKYGLPIAFAIAVADNSLSNTIIVGQISVQRLATSPPTFAQSTS